METSVGLKISYWSCQVCWRDPVLTRTVDWSSPSTDPQVRRGALHVVLCLDHLDENTASYELCEWALGYHSVMLLLILHFIVDVHKRSMRCHAVLSELHVLSLCVYVDWYSIHVR